MNKKIALWITNHVGTMACAYIFAVIGIMGVIGALTNNLQLTLIIGSVSGYFLQLVLLPIILVGQNVQSESSDQRMEKMLQHISEDNDRILTEVTEILKDIEHG